MKRFLAVLFTIFSIWVSANSQELWVKGSEKNLYLDHKVLAKENFYSVGRLYNISPKEIAAYNKLDMNKGLNLGQVIKIPLVANNFSQSVSAGTPVYYKVGEKETLTKVSAVNNGVTLENIRRWNNLGNDRLNAGSRLIVGFLNSNEMPAITVAEKKPAPVEEKKTLTTPETKPPVTNPQVELRAEEKIVQKEPEPAKPVTEEITYESLPSGDAGYFKTSFEQQVKEKPVSKNETVTSGIFKTSSGWQDAKYYLLMDAVQPGTVVKIINPENNKIVYAKVLGEMSGIRQNEGVSIRISNAAASVLQIADIEKFIVKVTY